MSDSAVSEDSRQLPVIYLDRYCQGRSITFIASLLLSSLLLLALWPMVGHDGLLAWVFTVWLVQAVQWAYAQHYLRERIESVNEQRRWMRGFLLGAAITGVSWSAAFYFMDLTGSNPASLLLIFAVAGVSGYAGVMMAIVLPIAIVFELAVVLPLCIWLFAQGDRIHDFMGVASLLYLAMLYLVSRQIHALSVQMISLKAVNRAHKREFLTLAESFPDIVIRYDRAGRRIYVNRGMAELVGKPPGDMIGETLLEATPLIDRDVYAAELEKVMANGIPSLLEVSARGANGALLLYEARFMPEFNEHGKVCGVLVVASDITAHKRIEAVLQRSEVDFRTLAENLPAAVIRYDDKQCRRYLNPSAERMLHGRAAELLGNVPGGPTVPATPAMIEFYRSEMEKVMATDAAREMEFVLDALPAGQHEYYEVRFMPEHGADGKPSGVLSIWFDITERKRMEHELRLKEDVLDQARIGIYLIDENGCITYVNNEACRALGYSREVLLTKTIPEIDASVSIDETLAVRQRTMDDGAFSFETLHVRSDGSLFPVEVWASTLEYQGKTVGVALAADISERRMMELALQTSEREFRTLAENMPDILIRYDREGHRTYVNPALTRIYAVRAELMIGLTQQESNPFNMPETYQLALEHTLATGERSEVELQIPASSGDMRANLIFIAAERAADGQILGAITIGHDITERKQAEALLVQRERDFRSLADNLPDNVARWDAEGRYLYINRTYERTIGVAASEVIGKPIPDSHEHVIAAIAQVVATGERLELVRQTVLVDGELQIHEVTLVPEFDDAGHVLSVLGLGRDMTAILETERRLSGLVENLPGIAYSFRLSPEGVPNFTYLSAEVEAIYGITPEMAMSDFSAIHNLAHPDDRPRIEAGIAESARTLMPYRVESRVCRSGHPEHWLDVRAVPQAQPDGSILWSGIMLDITARKQVQQKLELLDRAVDMSADAVFLMNEQLRFVYVNETACRALGYSRDELLAMDVCDIDPDIPREVVVKMIKESPLGVASTIETRHRAKDGHTFPVEISGVPFEEGGVRFGLTVARDITERKGIEQVLIAREQELRRQAQFQQSLLFGLRDAGIILVVVENGGFVYTNDHYVGCQLGYAEGQLPSTVSFIELIHPDDRPRIAAMHRDRLAGKPVPDSYEIGALGGDGSRCEYEFHVTLVPDTDPPQTLLLTLRIDERKRIEDALRANQEKLSTLFALSPLGIALTDMQGNYVEFNEAFREICAYPTDELMTLDYWALTPKKYEAKEAWQLESLAQTGRYGPYEKEYRQKDGTLIPIQLSGMLVTGKDGQSYIWSIVEDIRARKKSEVELKEKLKRIADLNQYLEKNARDLEEQTVELEMSKEQLQQTEAWYRSILHSAPDGMLIVDSRGYIMQVNAQLEAMFGYEGGELPGCLVEVLLPQMARASHVDKRSGFVSSGQRDRRMAGEVKDLFARRKDGSEFPVDVSLSRLPDLDGRMGATCAAVRDMTERQKADVARESALSEALRLAQLRSAFLAQMSHELRTPLNGILGYTQNLLHGEELGENQRSGLNIIQHSGEHLLTLINGILDHAAIEADKFQLITGDIELESFLTTLIGIIRVRAEQKNIAFSCDAGHDLPAVVCGDAQRLRQVLLNLLSNAVKFTDKGEVILRVRCPAPLRLRFEVQDSGVGIDADKMDSIFLPFEQVGEISRRAGGTGLGLAISRKLVELMGGTIKVESRAGAGSVFSFEIEMAVVASDTAKVNAQALFERAATRGPVLPSSLFAPSRADLDVLHALVLRGNMRDITRQAKRLADLDSRYEPFSEQLQHLAKGFQTKALLGFIAQYRDEKECE